MCEGEVCVGCVCGCVWGCVWVVAVCCVGVVMLCGVFLFVGVGSARRVTAESSCWCICKCFVDVKVPC